MKALVTGGEGGLGRAMRARLEREGYEVESLDLVDGFDVTDPAAWERVGAVDLACLNAGVLTGETRSAALVRTTTTGARSRSTSTVSCSACAASRR